MNFKQVNDFERISTKSGKVVEVVHTCASLGLDEAVGHVDFFINGGKHQPSCSIWSPQCSHLLSFEYWIAALENPRSFVGVRCSSYGQFLENQCDHPVKAYMAGERLLYKRGKYYLQTKNYPPYGLGDEGTKPVNGQDLLQNIEFGFAMEKAKNMLVEFKSSILNNSIFKNFFV